MAGVRGTSLGWSGLTWYFWTGAVEPSQHPGSTGVPEGILKNGSSPVASLRRCVNPKGRTAKGAKGAKGGDDTTTQRRDEKAGFFRVLVLGRESRLRPWVVWGGLVFWTGAVGPSQRPGSTGVPEGILKNDSSPVASSRRCVDPPLRRRVLRLLQRSITKVQYCRFLAGVAAY